MLTRRHHELPWGAQPGPGGVRFRLWAPRAAAVAVRLEAAPSPLSPAQARVEGAASSPALGSRARGNDDLETEVAATLPMTAEGGGWFALTTGRAGPGTRYRYVVDGHAYPDPASRRQPEGVHGPSEVVDPRAYRWTDEAWRGRRWEEIVIYELHLGTFSESGDFAGAIAHLDHVRALGATAIELMPIAEFPGARDWGYDGTQLYAPSSRYGPPEALKRLVEACHARGLAILLDVVYNHFGPEGNYLPAIAPDFFTERHRTPWGAALDFDGPHSRPVRDFMIENALYWLEEYHVDGLRFDAVHAIHDDSDPDILSELARTVRTRIANRPVHLVLENDRNEAHYLTPRGGYSAQWNDDLHHALHVLVTGETAGFYGDYAARPAERLGRALAEGFAYQGEPSPFRDGRPRGEPSAGLPPIAFVSFIQNHDHVGNHPLGTRISTRAAEPALHAAVAIVLLSPQIPLLFMGEEWASARPFAFFCDFEPGLADSVRAGRRREFAHFPGFSDEKARQRIPDPTAAATFAMSCLDWAEPEAAGHAQWLARYRDLLALRAREIVPRLAGIAGHAGHYAALGDRAVRVQWRLGDGSRLSLIANFAAAPIGVPDPPGRLLYASAEVAGAPCSAAFFLSSA
jgi:malto-oligosyltrehalose trehalohydrolase